MIVFNNVSKLYGDNIGIQDVNIKINRGDFVFLVGSSGAGKSTFIRLILKEIEADEGEIYLDDLEVTDLSNRMVPQLRRRIGIVFQDFRLLPNKTVFENVAFAMEVIHKKNKLIKKQVPEVLSLVGISSKQKNYPKELSAGEQQRVAIARALINTPDILIADEPTGNLDPDTAWEIMKLLESINQRGTTILMVTHAKDIVDRMGKRVIAIANGRIIRDDKTGSYGEELIDYSNLYNDSNQGEIFDEQTYGEDYYYEEPQGNVFGEDNEKFMTREILIKKNKIIGMPEYDETPSDLNKSATVENEQELIKKEVFEEIFRDTEKMSIEERIAYRRRKREEAKSNRVKEENKVTSDTVEIKTTSSETVSEIYDPDLKEKIRIIFENRGGNGHV